MKWENEDRQWDIRSYGLWFKARWHKRIDTGGTLPGERVVCLELNTWDRKYPNFYKQLRKLLITYWQVCNSLYDIKCNIQSSVLTGDGLKQSKTSESSVIHPSHHLVLQLSSRQKIQQLLEKLAKNSDLARGEMEDWLWSDNV